MGDQMAEKLQQLLTLFEVSEFLQIGERTIYQWVQKGTIPGFKLGNVWRFRREDIEAWIEEQKNKTVRQNSSSVNG